MNGWMKKKKKRIYKTHRMTAIKPQLKMNKHFLFPLQSRLRNYEKGNCCYVFFIKYVRCRMLCVCVYILFCLFVWLDTTGIANVWCIERSLLIFFFLKASLKSYVSLPFNSFYFISLLHFLMSVRLAHSRYP